MVIIPKGKVLIQGLNSFYLDIGKMCEYYHEMAAPCAIFFTSPSSKAILYYDQSDYIGGGVRVNNAKDFDTQDVVEKLKIASGIENFEVTVYKVELNDIYFWSSLFHATPKYSGLKSDFTDLAALIKRMKSEGLSGYIEVYFEDKHGGDLFFQNGAVVHSQCVMKEKPPEGLPGRDPDLSALLYFSKRKQGHFNVKEILICQPSTNEKTEQQVPSGMDVGHTCAVLELVLGSLNKVLSKKQPRGFDFSLTLKKKFIEKAGIYDFLDPFANEFQYKGTKVLYQGTTDIQHVADAVIDTAWELAAEHRKVDQFGTELDSLKKRYPKELKYLNHGA